METKEKLVEELERSIESLQAHGSDTEEYARTADNIVKLYKLKLEEDKMALDKENKAVEWSEKIKDRLTRVGIGAAEIVVPAILYWILMNRGFKFEETGTVTSSFFRNLIGKVKPNKK